MNELQEKSSYNRDRKTRDLEWKVSVLQVLGKDVQHANHLREDENTMTAVTQPQQQLVQQYQLATALHQQLHTQSTTTITITTTTTITITITITITTTTFSTSANAGHSSLGQHGTGSVWSNVDSHLDCSLISISVLGLFSSCERFAL